MMRLLIGVLLGAAIATAVSHIYNERDKQLLVDELARQYEFGYQRDDAS
ncbi:MAG TPA: hypothetical protein PKA10_14175 [Selenomonadales bacterium]|nr:hypothetical protein [Selenomonadales bacterium]